MGIIVALPSAMVNQFGFEDMEKGLSYCVIPTVSFATHTLYEMSFLKCLGKSSTSILDASIRMDQEPFGWLPSSTGVLQS
jgi:hypothetical protein